MPAKKTEKITKSKSQSQKSTANSKDVKVSKAKTPKTEKSNLSAKVFDTAGKSQGTVNLPKEIFGTTPNMSLLTQAYRIYFANQKTHIASAKTRSEVQGGGRKPWRQKGTGRARAGSTRSPLWVGGGVTFGPIPRNVKLNLPTKMRRKALTSALSLINKNGSLYVISNFEKMPAKTKTAVNLFSKLELSGKTLLVVDAPKTNIRLAVRNIPQTSVDIVDNLNAFKVMSINNLLLEKSAIEKLKK